ncbi:thiaminase/transcriptional activator TenA [Bacillus thermophilus]|uniref:Aminopyrimidine aminohydrolase n=1 Tax=Siminovitchia thermophila TaxID=1245522 RepID=A0ABS2R9M9_9BACI|nr:thiaminase II [Siminovitchia thermophila]MBM7716350.1 thiaminase/transcriptional activator TenA [Siminovitchia thermophila]
MKVEKMLFTDRLYESAKEIWEKSYNHPFVQGVGKGTLDQEIFEYYMKQDYVYLIDYVKLFAIGAQKAPTLEIMTKFSHLLHEHLHFEMELHRQFAAEFGISNEELENTEPAPVNLAYTRYMLHVAHNGTLAELVASLLPCAWHYAETGERLKEQYGATLESNPYRKWVETYSSEEFTSLGKWLIDLMNQLADGKPERELAELEKHFLITSKYEYLFWDMNYHQQNWTL